MSTTNDTSTNKQDQSEQAIPKTQQELTDEDLSEMSGGKRCDGNPKTDQTWYHVSHQMSINKKG